ncbi:MAG: DsbA family protein [Candidatus Omnitrophota bacterium]
MEKNRLMVTLIIIALFFSVLNLSATLILNLTLSKIFNLLLAERQARMSAPAQPRKLTAPARLSVSADDDAILGAKNAAVTIVEFTDYQCPFSSRFFNETLPQLKKKYIESGKAKLVFRDFPLGFHQQAMKAAEAAECAGEQGKYFEYHDQIFKDPKSLDLNQLKKIARAIGLDSARFNACLDAGEMAAEVKKDMRDAQKYEVQSTPTFFINGIIIRGAQPYAAFEELIEKELKNRKP